LAGQVKAGEGKENAAMGQIGKPSIRGKRTLAEQLEERRNKR